MANTRAHANRAIRQEALREQLAEQCRLQHIVENLKKIDELDMTMESSKDELQKWKTSTELRVKLMSKYLPDLKQVELDLGDDTTEAVKIIWGKSRS